MAVGRMRHEWDMTSLIWCALAEPNRDRKKRLKPFTPYDVHPFRSESDVAEEPIKADISVLKMLLNNA